MWVACKKRKIEYEESPSKKRKWFFHVYVQSKRIRLPISFKRKAVGDSYDTSTKKQKVCKKNHCLIHDEEYICSIYECGGVKDYSQQSFMPYIN